MIKMLKTKKRIFSWKNRKIKIKTHILKSKMKSRNNLHELIPKLSKDW